MKNTRHQVTIAILLTASLLVAPLAIAQPQAPSSPGFDFAGFFSDLVQEITSVFAPATTTFDPNGLEGDGTDEGTGEGDGPSEGGESDDDATTVFDPNG